jgi:O-antigen/teichoic acid export membrane protein
MKKVGPRARATDVDHVQKFASQSAVLLSTGLFSYLGGLALQLLLARALRLEEFGSWIVAFSFVEVLSVAGLMGGDWLLLRQGSYYQGIGDLRRLRATIRLALSMSAIALTAMGVALLVLGPVVAVRVFNNESTGSLLRLAGIVGPVFGIRQMLLYGTQAFKSVRDAALIRNLAQPIARLVFVSIAVLKVSTPEAAFVGLLIAEVLLMVGSAVLLNRRVSMIGPTDHIDRKALILFAGSVLGSRIVEGLRNQTSVVVLGALATVSASGLFAASRRLTAAPGLMTSAMNQVYSPMASELFLRENKGDLEVLIKSMARWIFVFAFPFFCLLAAFPGELLSIFGESFRDASDALVVLAIGMLFLIATGPVTTTLIVVGRPRLAFLDNMLALIAEIGLGFLLVPTYGIIGAAVAATFGRFVNNVVPLLQVWRILRVHPYRADFWKPAVAGLCAVGIARVAVVALGMSSLTAAASAVILTGAVYISLLLIFGVSRDDRAALDRLLVTVRRGWRRQPQTSSDH